MKELNQDKSLVTETYYMLAKQLKILLKRDSITVINLAKATGLNTKTLYNYLDGRSPRNLDHIRILCAHFKVSSDELLFGIKSTVEKEFKDYEEEINAGKFEVILRRLRK